MAKREEVTLRRADTNDYVTQASLRTVPAVGDVYEHRQDEWRVVRRHYWDPDSLTHGELGTWTLYVLPYAATTDYA